MYIHFLSFINKMPYKCVLKFQLEIVELYPE